MDNRELTGLSSEDGRIRPALARILMHFRALAVAAFALLTVFFAWQMTQLRPAASFEKMIPVEHPFIANYLDNRDDLSGLANSVRIIVEAAESDIFTESFQETLKQITDEVFYIEGVDRAGLQSLWTPNVRWQDVTEEGFVGGTVIPDDYDGSSRTLEKLRNNALKSGQIGRLVANDFNSAIVFAPLTSSDPETGKKLDYHRLASDFERLVRDKYQSPHIRIHITGFAKLVGDLIDGAILVGTFFAIAFAITALLLYVYSRCHWCTLAALGCSTAAVIWQLGLLHLMGMGLDPYSMLVPFLIFAVGISHSVQIINRFAHYRHRRLDNRKAAELTFVRLSKPGFIALVSDGVGFMTLRVIEIPVIQELAIVAGTGVALLIVTNLVILPVILSYTGISERCNRYRDKQDNAAFKHWRLVSAVTKPTPAKAVIAVAAVLFVAGGYFGQQQKIGDLDSGAPELRPDSRYNRDVAYLAQNYSTSTDVFVVMVHTRTQQCGSYLALSAVERFQRVMENVGGVQSSLSLVDISKLVIMGMNEGNPKWHALNRNQYILNNSLSRVPSSLLNDDCSMVPVIVFLEDHRADTLNNVVMAAELFADEHNSEHIQFRLAAGNAGIEAATNIVISTAQYKMLAWVYGVVTLLCLLTFRSPRITACIILPLLLTSATAQGLMALLDIGVKVATLPVIALGVGIGVDYGIYIYSSLQNYLQRGIALRDAYFESLKTTGTAVAFTGLTLAIGVGTWIFSPIKFQADMGLMLTFMFVWNMLGALLLLPALAWLLHTGTPPPRTTA